VAYFMVSVDKPEDNKAFAEKEQADFPILSDPDKTVANAYGVIPPNRPPERQLAQRWTFYIDPQGKIAVIDKSGKTATAGEAIIQNLTEMKVPKAKKPGAKK
jgi:peroxiredoxin Q/BCP